MVSDSVTDTFVGAGGRIAPAAGVELTYWAWAAARPLAKSNPRSPARRGRRILRGVMASSFGCGTLAFPGGGPPRPREGHGMPRRAQGSAVTGGPRPRR